MRAGPKEKEGKILRSASKLTPPATWLDRALYVLVATLWCCVGATWATARARLLESRMTLKLAQSNGHRAALLDFDWWQAGRAKLQSWPGLGANRTHSRRLGRDIPQDKSSTSATTIATEASVTEASTTDSSKTGAAEGAAAEVEGAGQTALGTGMESADAVSREDEPHAEARISFKSTSEAMQAHGSDMEGNIRHVLRGQ